MNAKKFITKEGKEVTYGDLIKWQTEKTEDGYYCKSSYAVTLTENNACLLVEEGIIKQAEEEIKERDYFTEAAEAVFSNLKEDPDGPFWDTYKKIMKAYPGAASSMMLKELANIFNKEQGEDITKASVVYGVSPVDGKIIKIFTDPADSTPVVLNMFAAFVNFKDAEKARDILSLNKLYEQKD